MFGKQLMVFAGGSQQEHWWDGCKKQRESSKFLEHHLSEKYNVTIR